MVEKNVSVIIPTYNRAHILYKTIPSYIQEITKEVIIVDDGSDDCTGKVVKWMHEKYKEIKYIRLKKHMGLTHAKNIGVKKAQGQYIYFGDDDACLYKGTLLRLRDALETFPADIAGAHGSYATEWKQIWRMDDYIEHYFVVPFTGRCIMDFDTGRINFRYRIDHITEGLCVMACFMLRAELAKKVKFDLRYVGNAAREDMDYLLQHAERGSKIVYVPDTYEIDIPKYTVKGGGCQSYGFWKSILYTFQNVNYFINKHYTYLRREGYMTVSKKKAMLVLMKNIVYDQIIPRIKGLFAQCNIL